MFTGERKRETRERIRLIFLTDLTKIITLQNKGREDGGEEMKGRGRGRGKRGEFD